MKPEDIPLETGGHEERERSPWGKFSLLVKLNLTIGLSFLVTMSFFLFMAYRSETRFELDHSVRLLRSTLEIVTSMIPQDEVPSADQIGTLQARLDAAGVHHHEIFLVDLANRVLAAANTEYQGRLLSELFPDVYARQSSSDDALVGDEKGRWLRVSKPLSRDRTLYLFLDWGHVTSNLLTFWALHGAHVLVTLVLFFLLLWLVTEKCVRARLLVLQTAIRRIEMGHWEAGPEILSSDELGWLYDRFKRMGQRLKENVDRLVRVEKYASAAIMVLRVGRELSGPLASIRKNLRSLSGASHKDTEVAVILADLDRSLHDIDRSLQGLSEIKHPDEWGVQAPVPTKEASQTR